MLTKQCKPRHFTLKPQHPMVILESCEENSGNFPRDTFSHAKNSNISIENSTSSASWQQPILLPKTSARLTTSTSTSAFVYPPSNFLPTSVQKLPLQNSRLQPIQERPTTFFPYRSSCSIAERQEKSHGTNRKASSFYSTIDSTSKQTSAILAKLLEFPSHYPGAMPYLEQMPRQSELTSQNSCHMTTSTGLKRSEGEFTNSVAAKPPHPLPNDGYELASEEKHFINGSKQCMEYYFNDLEPQKKKYQPSRITKTSSLRHKKQHTLAEGNQQQTMKAPFLEMEIDLDELQEGDIDELRNSQACMLSTTTTPQSNSSDEYDEDGAEEGETDLFVEADGNNDEDAAMALMMLSNNPSKTQTSSQMQPHSYPVPIRPRLAAAVAATQAQKNQTALVLYTQSNSGRSQSSPLRRQAHIASEQKRRQTINEGFEELRALVPTCLNFSDSKASILKKTVHYVKFLQDKVDLLSKQSESDVENAKSENDPKES